MKITSNINQLKIKTFEQEISEIFEGYVIRHFEGCSIDGKKEFLNNLEYGASIDSIALVKHYGVFYMVEVNTKMKLVRTYEGCFSFGYSGEGQRASQWVLDVLGIKEEVPTDNFPSNDVSVAVIYER